MASTVRLEIPVEDGADLEALEQAILRARATELGEVRRLELRLGAGYGDAGTRLSMTVEEGRARRRWTMLDRLLAALRSTATGTAR
jgi:hypothetical protein